MYKIRLSFRDKIAENNMYNFKDFSETPESNPKHDDNSQLANNKKAPQDILKIKIDKKRSQTTPDISMGLNVRNQLSK